MLFSTRPVGRKNVEAQKEAPAMQRELIRIYAQVLGAVTEAMNASLLFRETLPGVSALFAALSRDEATSLLHLGELLRHVQIPVLPNGGGTPPERESPAESAKLYLQLQSEGYRIRAAHYRRVARMARSEETARVLEALAADTGAHAEALLAMYTRLCRS